MGSFVPVPAGTRPSVIPGAGAGAPLTCNPEVLQHGEHSGALSGLCWAQKEDGGGLLYFFKGVIYILLKVLYQHHEM